MKKIFMLLPMALFAQDTGALTRGGATQTLTIVIVGFALFYLILWRPDQKRRQAADKMRSLLKKGDRVTAMGIRGTVDKINEDTVILTMVDGSKIEMLKLAITDVNQVTSVEEK